MPTDLHFVFDTSAIVSAVLLKGSVVRLAFDQAVAQGKLLVSQATIDEVNEVLRRKGFDRYVLEEERIEFVTALVRDAVLVEITETIRKCRDPKDDKFLELAVCGHAACIVSGDDDLLSLNPFRGIPIVSPREFLDGTWRKPATVKRK